MPSRRGIIIIIFLYKSYSERFNTNNKKEEMKNKRSVYWPRTMPHSFDEKSTSSSEDEEDSPRGQVSN